MDTKEEQTVAYYDQQAELWSSHRKGDFWLPEIQRLHNLAPEGGKLLEVGCSVGAEAGELAQFFDYTGIDLSLGSLVAARQAHPDLRFLEQSLYELDFGDSEFDVLWSAATYLHVPKAKLAEALREARRVLKPNGVAFFSVREGDSEGMVEQLSYGKPSLRFMAHYTPEEFAQVLTEAGFEVIDHYSRPASKPGYPNHLAAFVRRS